jgi:anti-anti-sigma regulatory factor
MSKPARGCDHPTDRFMYYMHDEFAAFRLLLIGDLSQGSAAELDEARQTASSIFNRRPLIVDLTGIDSMDNAGRELIRKWHGLGAQLMVTSPEAQARIQSMTNMPIVFLETKRRSKWLRLPALLAPTATLLMLLMLMLMGRVL